MAKSKKNTEAESSTETTSIETAHTSANSNNLHELIANSLQANHWFFDLTVDEQVSLTEKSDLFAQSLISQGLSRIEQGKLLTEINAMLQPYNLFEKYLSVFRFPIRTAYRRMAEFDNGKRLLPDELLRQAMLAGIDILGDTSERPFGRYTDVILAEPPSDNITPQEAREYLMAVVAKKRESGTVRFQFPTPTREEVVKKCFQSIVKPINSLPTYEDKMAAIAEFVGYIMAAVGIGAHLEIDPRQVPDGWIIRRGRPKSLPAPKEESNAA